MIDIRSFGAVGDGIADDTLAVRKALEETAGKDVLENVDVQHVDGWQFLWWFW